MDNSLFVRAVEQCISEQIDKEIKEKTNEFYHSLVDRKDKYIAEVMSGIRIAHENNPELMYMDYRILFINKYEVDAHGGR